MKHKDTNKLTRVAMLLLVALFGLTEARAQQTLPYSYGFEDNDLSTDGWTTLNESTANASDFGINSAAAQTGTYGFRFSSFNRDNTSYIQYLFSPELNAPTGGTVQFSYKASSTYGTETFRVGYSATDTDPSSFTFGDEISTNSTTWTLSDEFTFPAGTKYVAIYYYSEYQYRLYVDDFIFEAASSVAKPTGLTVNYTGGTEATVSWISDENAFDLEVDGEVIEDVENGYVLENLELSTTYTIRVRAKKGTEVSNWSAPVSFTTADCLNPTIVNYSLVDSFGDGWNGNYILVYDEDDNEVAELTIESGASATGTLNLCGSLFTFYYWYPSSGNTYPGETSWTFTDVEGNEIFSGSGSNVASGDVLYEIDLTSWRRPTDFAATEVGPYSAKLSWTENSLTPATSWVIAYIGEGDTEVSYAVADTNPFILDGLTPETTYQAMVSPNNDDAILRWSDVISFTTDSAFPVPTELAVSPAATQATVTWDGTADSYNVRYTAVAPTSFFEDFENGLDAQGWTTIRNSDGNEYTDWRTFDATQFGDNNVTNHSGDYVAMSRSWSSDAYSVDNWLITPQVTLDGTLKYWVMDDGQYHEHYDIYVSTTGTDIGDFTLLYEPGDASSTWTEVSVDLSSYAGQTGYIAFRHTDEDQDFLFIDDFGIYNEVPASAWTTISTTETSAVLTGLNPETEYEVQVQAVYADGESKWVSATFTTPSETDAPIDLTATDVKATTATLNWTGSQDSYTLQYREALPVDPSEPATIILTAGDVWGDGSGYQMLLDADATAYGDVFTENGGWTATDYSAFEYTIPTDAECDMNTTAVVFDNSVSIQIPAGTYDWCILNPSSGDKIYIAASNGNVGGRQNDYVFEAGKTYEFVPAIYGSNDGIDVTVTRPMGEWVVVENVTTPYELTGLEPETYYEWQVQGNLKEGTTEWSEMSSFTTLISITVGSLLYTTFVAPSAVSFPSELTAFKVVDKTETAVIMEAVEAIPAGAAVVVKAEAAGTYGLEAATSTADMTGNLLKASDGTVTGGSGIYALANKDLGVGFYPVASTVTIPAGKAYLEIETKAKAFYGLFEDDATAIDNLNVDANLNETIYNLAGQRINKAQKGVNIINGKKILK